MATSSQWPASVHITLNRVTNAPGTYLLHMINTTSAPRRPVDGLIPVANLTVRVTLPEHELKGIAALRSEGDPVAMTGTERRRDGRLTVDLKVPELKEYQAVVIKAR